MATNQATAPLHSATYPQERVNQHLVAAGSAETAHVLRPPAGANLKREANVAWDDIECSYDLFDLQDSGLVAA
jgi:hypothetical protein